MAGTLAGTDMPDATTPVAGRAAVELAVAARIAGRWRLPPFATNGDKRLFNRLLRVRQLMHALTAAQVDAMLGAGAAAQIESADERRALASRLVEAKAGPDGGNAAKGLRSLRLLCAHARARGLAADGLPASAALVATIVVAETARAAEAARGSRGGATVGGTIRDGFLFLQGVVGLPVDANGRLVESVAEAPAGAADAPAGGNPVKHAASLPLGVQCQFEHEAAVPSTARRFARCFLVACLVHGVRANDALNANLWLEDGIIVGRTTVRSKDGLPLGLFAPGEGWLGPFDWLEEHFREMESEGRAHSIPDFSPALSAPASQLLPGVLPRHKLLPAVRDICARPPLSMTAAEFTEAGITAHSPHGTPADLVRFMGARGGFGGSDQRVAGHWLRDKSAAQTAPVRPARGVPAGARNERGAMALRYTQGSGRRGERQEQLDLRGRLVRALRGALEASPVPWHELPRSLESWDILIPPEE